MNITVEKRVEGAKKAVGLTVMIDVFRAFTLEAYAFDQGCEKIILVSSIQQAFALKQKHPEYVLVGERDGVRIEGFDFGNSPSIIRSVDLSGKTLVHTTTNGVSGIHHAKHASSIVTGEFVNAAAAVRYIKNQNPATVSLVAMGWKERDTEEDLLCAEYMKSLLQGRKMEDIDERLQQLRDQEGKKFFNPATQDIFPEADFSACIARDIFDFAIVIERGEEYDTARCIHA